MPRFEFIARFRLGLLSLVSGIPVGVMVCSVLGSGKSVWIMAVVVGGLLILVITLPVVVRLCRKRAAATRAELRALSKDLDAAIADKDAFDLNRWTPHLRMHRIKFPSEEVSREGQYEYVCGILPYLRRGNRRAARREAKSLLS